MRHIGMWAVLRANPRPNLPCTGGDHDSPPRRPSDEADAKQLEVARHEGEA
jgi:hypothetical protein